VLQLLQRAFNQKLTFTVGTSITTGISDCVVWNGELQYERKQSSSVRYTSTVFTLRCAVRLAMTPVLACCSGALELYSVSHLCYEAMLELTQLVGGVLMLYTLHLYCLLVQAFITRLASLVAVHTLGKLLLYFALASVAYNVL
jgi:Deltex C-terminal domain